MCDLKWFNRALLGVPGDRHLLNDCYRTGGAVQFQINNSRLGSGALTYVMNRGFQPTSNNIIFQSSSLKFQDVYLFLLGTTEDLCIGTVGYDT